MSKRKFEEISKSSPPNDLTASQLRQQQRFLGYFENGQKQLLGALKLARGFERQKLGRRHKDAQAKSGKDDGKDVNRINAEIAALKALDLNSAAEFYIARTLCRIKTVVNGCVVPEEVLKQGQGRSPYQSPANVNVTARLFKSTAVKNAMESTEKQIRTLVKVSKQDSEQDVVIMPEQPKKSTNEADVESLSLTGSLHDDLPSAEWSDEVSAEDADETTDIDDSRTVSDDMNADDDHIERLASASNTDIESDVETTDDIPKERTFHDKEDTTISRSPSLSPKLNERKHPVVQPLQKKAPPVKKTTFLPTLASGYISGSDSESYGSDQDNGAAKPKQRNRMGQQARRALAEQQYGSAAKHLKGGKGAKSQGKAARDAGWDLKRGASDARGRSHRGRGGFISSASNRAPDREQQKPAPRAKDDTGSLHPSWTAKKKLKEQQNLGVGAFQGKKVVFD